MSDIQYNLYQIKKLNDKLNLEVHNTFKHKISELSDKALLDNDFDTIESLIKLRGDIDCM